MYRLPFERWAEIQPAPRAPVLPRHLEELAAPRREVDIFNVF